MSDSIPKMLMISGAGLAVSTIDIETILRCASIAITTTLSVIVFVRDMKKRKREK